MTEVIQNKYEFVDDAACVCGVVVGYKIAKSVFSSYTGKTGVIFKIGSLLIEMYVGLEVGGMLRDRTRKIRKGICMVIKDLQKEDQNGGSES